MPQIRLVTINGDRLQTVTRDPGQLAAWLTEWIPQIFSSHPANNTVRLEVYPWHTDSGAADWPPNPDGGLHPWPGEPMTATELHRIVDVLQSIADDRGTHVTD